MVVTNKKRIEEMKTNKDRYRTNGKVKHEDEIYMVIEDCYNKIVNHIHIEDWV
jgi:hypothetical protein